jgi:hypothetical protein
MRRTSPFVGAIVKVSYGAIVLKKSGVVGARPG